MKKMTVLLAAALAAAVTFGQASGAKQDSLASARAKITQVIDKPDDMASVMSSLSAKDQVAYLSETLTAIAAMPASDAERTEKFVAVVNSALASSQKDNALDLVAEVYAKVPPYALAAVSESLASGLMNRSTLPKVATNQLYVGIATKVMAKINERVSGEDNAGVRSAFAALMLIRASNSDSPEIVSAIVDALPESVRDDAKTEWLPAALGQGRDKSYEPIMSAVDGEESKPAYGVSSGAPGDGSQSRDADQGGDSGPIAGLRVPTVQGLDSLLADIAGIGSDPRSSSNLDSPLTDSATDPENTTSSLGTGDAADSNAGETIVNRVENETEQQVTPPVTPEPEPEPTPPSPVPPYQNQTT